MDKKSLMEASMKETGLSRIDTVFLMSHQKVMGLGQEIVSGRSTQDAVEFMFDTLYNMASDYDTINIDREPIFVFMAGIVLNNAKTIKATHSQMSWIKRKMGVDRLVKSSMLVLTGVSKKIQIQVNEIRGSS